MRGLPCQGAHFLISEWSWIKENLFPVARLIPGGDAIQVTRIQAQRGTDVIYTLIII